MKTFLWVKSILGGINTISLFEFIPLVTLCFLSTVLAPCSRTVQAARADRHKGIHGAEGLAPPSLCFCALWSLCLKFCLPLLCFGVTSSRKPSPRQAQAAFLVLSQPTLPLSSSCSPSEAPVQSDGFIAPKLNPSSAP